VVGYPNLNEVLYFAVGVVNADPADTLSGPVGKVWLDEMRVTDVRKDVGTAGRISVGGNLADLLTYSFGYQSQDPYFRQISAATRGGGDNNLGSGQTQTSYNYNLTFNPDRFLPRAWGARLPFSIPSPSRSTRRCCAITPTSSCRKNAVARSNRSVRRAAYPSRSNSAIREAIFCSTPS